MGQMDYKEQGEGVSDALRNVSASNKERNLKAQRGGKQGNAISGETEEGAHNAQMENRNRQGNKADRSQSNRQEDKNF